MSDDKKSDDDPYWDDDKPIKELMELREKIWKRQREQKLAKQKDEAEKAAKSRRTSSSGAPRSTTERRKDELYYATRKGDLVQKFLTRWWHALGQLGLTTNTNSKLSKGGEGNVTTPIKEGADPAPLSPVQPLSKMQRMYIFHGHILVVSNLLKGEAQLPLGLPSQLVSEAFDFGLGMSLASHSLIWSCDANDDEYTNLCLCNLCFLLFLFIYSSLSISISFLHYTLILLTVSITL